MKSILYILLLTCLLGIFSCKNNRTQPVQDEVSILLPDESEWILLSDSGSIPIDEGHLFLDFIGNPCLNIDSLIFIMAHNQNSRIISLPFSLMPDEICCFADGSMYVLQDANLSKITDNTILFTLPMPYKSMHISKAGESGLYLTCNNSIEKIYDLYFIDNIKKSIEKILSDTLPINAVIGNGEVTMTAIDSVVYLLADGEMQAVFKADNTIMALADGGNGVFFSTLNSVGYFDDNGQYLFFYPKGASKLLTYKDTLYLLDTEGRFSLITKTDSFRNFTDSITQK